MVRIAMGGKSREATPKFTMFCLCNATCRCVRAQISIVRRGIWGWIVWSLPRVRRRVAPYRAGRVVRIGGGTLRVGTGDQNSCLAGPALLDGNV